MKLLGNIIIPELGRIYLNKHKDDKAFCINHELKDVYRSRSDQFGALLEKHHILL